jgi:pimeloyl-ACP methyl ester carboxylesterase
VLTACSSPAGTRPSGGQGAAVSTPAPATEVPAALRRFYGQHLRWSSCGRFSCSTLTVPEDYARPDGRSLHIAVIRDQTISDPAGSLIVNPGGPGGSGVQFVREAASAFTPLLQHFALVSFDPRGVGQSDPVRCVGTPFLDSYLNEAPAPHSSAQDRQFAAQARQFADDCFARNGSYLEHVGTIDAARDMDVLRSALGDRSLTYYGASYGTYLGAKYAQLFPQNIRAMVLDGAVNPAQSTLAADRQQAVGFETDLTDFLANCVSSGGCPLGTSDTAAMHGLDRLLAQVTAHPEPVGGGRTLGPGNFFNGLASGFYDSSDWPQLRSALKAVQAGNGAPLLAFADALSGRNDHDNTYSNLLESNVSINCIDRPSPRSLAAYRSAARSAAAVAPFFGPAIVWSSLPCAYWRVPPVEDAHPVSAANTAHPLLVLGVTHDPATPYVQAQALTRQLGNARLVTLDGDGHTAFLRGDSCIDGLTDDYLETLRLPASGVTCH